MKKSIKADKVFKAIADPTRREIFHLLMVAGTAMSLTRISLDFEISRQGVTKHVKLLEEAGLVSTYQQGRERFCEADPTPLHEIRDWIGVYDRLWETKMQSLEKYLKRRNN